MSEDTVEVNVAPELKSESSDVSATEKEFKRTTYWYCCKGKVDKRAVRFFSQLTISIIVMIFSLYQLYRDKNTDIYLSLLTMIIGVFIEAPRLT